MRVAPVSGDMLLKIGIIGAVVGASVWMLKRQASAVGKSAGEAASAIGNAINPTSDTNIFYQAASGLGNAASSDGQNKSLGVRAWEILNPGAVAAENAAMAPVSPAAPNAVWDKNFGIIGNGGW